MAESAALPTVFQRDGDDFSLDQNALAQLVESARASEKKRARICLHRGHDEAIQQMVICLVRGFPVGPLRQKTGLKTYCSISGSIMVTFYREDGSVERKERLAPSGAGSPVLSFPTSTWQSCEAETETAVYLEVQPGPFDPAATEWR
jgi:cupin fold WbuC family metalloprotein